MNILRSEEDPCELKPIKIGEDLEKPEPLIKSGFNLNADMMFGWKPEDGAMASAPIPLHYSY